MGIAAWPAAPVAAFAADASLAAQANQRMTTEPVVRGAFEQRKVVKGFRNPLVSRGEFVVSRERGVWWRTQEPFASTLVVTRDRVLAKQADGTVLRKLSAGDEPAVHTISETLFALMAADISLLQKRFDIGGELVGKEGWHLVLTPRDAALQRWLQRVDLEGDRYLRQVRLQEASGDHTVIVLARHATAKELTPAEENDLE